VEHFVALSPLNPYVTSPMNLIALVLVVAVLYFTRDVCVPFILAILLSFMLSPIVSWLRRWGLPRVPAAIGVMALLLLVLGLCGWLVGGQLIGLTEKLPQYQATVHEKLKSFQTAPGGLMDRLNRTFESYAHEFESIGTDTPTKDLIGVPTQTSPAIAAGTTVVAPTPISKVAVIERVLLGMVSPITTCGVILILSLFLLIRQEDVRDRAIRLLGGGQLQVATKALDDAGARVSRFLLIQIIVNVSFGVCIGVGLFFIGVPYCLLWGLLASALRFVPYFGAPIAAVAPLFMAFAAVPGWTAVILTLVLFAVMELSIANVVEPWLYGAHARVSPLAIVASAIFWSWLWGPIGLLLSMPLTVCLVVVGQHVPRLSFLSVLLGDEPALTPEVRFYQRLLARDEAEAWELADARLKETSLEDLYDNVLIPALILAKEDRHRQELDDTRASSLFQSMRDLLEDLAGRSIPAPVTVVPEREADVTARVSVEVEAAPGAATAPPVATAEVAPLPKVLCIPAHDEADELAAIMLAQLLGRQGLSAEVVSFNTLASERIAAVAAREAGLVCVSALPPQALLRARYLCTRLCAQHPKLKLIAGLWHDSAAPVLAAARLPEVTADGVTTTLAAAVARIAALARHEAFRTDGPQEHAASAARGSRANAGELNSTRIPVSFTP